MGLLLACVPQILQNTYVGDLEELICSHRQEVHEHAKLAGPPCQRKLRNATDRTQFDFIITFVKRLPIYFDSIWSIGSFFELKIKSSSPQ